VVLDVPCTGTGAWRRRPDAKWRLKEAALALRVAEQDAILQDGAACLKPGGALVYITCSLLAEENEDRVTAFLASREGTRFSAVDLKPRWRSLFGSAPPAPPPGVGDTMGLRLSPRVTATDGFFVAMLRAG
jgi:16S rRNA (cytosine967-C5)-methyltransferase